MSYYCVGSHGDAKHCLSRDLDQCDYCAWYQSGDCKPSFNLPAIEVSVVIFPKYITINRYNGRVGINGPGYESVRILE